MRVTFEIPGKPFAKQRPRFSRKSGQAYTPKATESYESLVRAKALPLFPKPLIGPVIVEIIAIFEPAASWSKAKRETALYRPHIQRPDADNLGKCCCDGLNRVAFADDGQIYDLRIKKMWGLVAKTVVTVEGAA